MHTWSNASKSLIFSNPMSSEEYRLSIGVYTLRDHVRNENIKERLEVESIAERCRNARLRWFGPVKRRDQDYIGRKTLEMVPRKKARKTEAEMDGLCQPRDESHRNDERRGP